MTGAGDLTTTKRRSKATLSCSCGSWFLSRDGVPSEAPVTCVAATQNSVVLDAVTCAGAEAARRKTASTINGDESGARGKPVASPWGGTSDKLVAKVILADDVASDAVGMKHAAGGVGAPAHTASLDDGNTKLLRNASG